MILVDPVHTTGINWDSFLANTAAIIVILTAFAAVIVRIIRGTIKSEVEHVIASEVTPTLNLLGEELTRHDTRIARLEGVEEGKKQIIDQAGIHKTS